MPRKHYCYTRSILYGIGDGRGGGGGGGCKSDYKDCFRSQKKSPKLLFYIYCILKLICSLLLIGCWNQFASVPK